jgi:hypothetical protein
MTPPPHVPATGDRLAALWEVLSQALAQAGLDPGRERLFLAKLALLLAREVDDPDRVAALAATALRDLE